MVRHIVMWRLASAVKRADGSPENIARIQSNVAAMRAQMPGLVRVEIGVNAAPSPDASDLMLLAEFDDWEALRGYERHPLHDELRALIGPLRTERRVLDCEIGEAQ